MQSVGRLLRSTIGTDVAMCVRLLLSVGITKFIRGIRDLFRIYPAFHLCPVVFVCVHSVSMWKLDGKRNSGSEHRHPHTIAVGGISD